MNSMPAVIICPGGGYSSELIKREGKDIASAFNKYGISAFVLKYRLPNSGSMENPSIGPLQDLQRAIKIVKERAQEFNVTPEQIGVMGFSAGGHLAAMGGTHFEDVVVQNKKGTSLKPDFMILVNPVISFTDSIGHMGSRKNLIGKNPSKEEIVFFSPELNVTEETPETFLVHSVEDSVVSFKNSLYFFKELNKYGVDTELHLYARGEHGFLTRPPFGEWFYRCIYWLKNEVYPSKYFEDVEILKK